MPQVTLRIEMFKPQKLGEWGDGTQADLYPTSSFRFGPFKDVVIPPRSAGGPPTTTVFVTTGAPVTNLLKLDAKDPEKITLLQTEVGDVSRQKLVVVPRVAFTQRNGAPFTGDVVATTTFNPGYSAIDVYDVTERGLLRHDIVPIGRKVLTENPDNVGVSNRYNTVFADGLAKGIGALVSANGLALYAAVERVGVMAVDAGKNSPQLGIGARVKEGLYTGDFTDLTIENNRIYAVSRAERRMVILNPDLSLVAEYTVGVPTRRVRVVSGFTFDADHDGFITPEETHRLAFLACDDGIRILDVTDTSLVYKKGFIPTQGVVKDLDIDLQRRRLFAVVDKGTQLVTMVDVTDPTVARLVDDDQDKADDRIIWELAHPGPNAIRIDSGRGLLFIAGPMLEVYAAYDICCDLGTDMTAAPKTEVVGDRKQLLLRERKAMQQEIKAGLDKAAKDCGLKPTDVQMLESGSGACLWDGDPANTCGSAYQPGLSDHDISMFFEERAWSTAAGDGTIQNIVGCTIKRLADRFTDPETTDPKPIDVDGTKIEFEEITFLPNRLSELRAARYSLERTDPTLPGDAVNDGALGRQLLVLRHSLEGRWLVRIDGWPVQGAPFDDILKKLREETRVAALEGHQYAKLMEFALAKASVYIRVKGASDEKSYFNGEFIKQLHSAGKAGIRATLGRIVADDRARERLMAIRRTRAGQPAGAGDGLLAFDENACLVIDPGQVPDEWQEGPCNSLEDYIASTAGRTLRLWRGDGPLNVFTYDEVVNKIARFYRVKADLGIIDDEAAADAFVAMAHRFVTRTVLPATQAVYDRDLPTLPLAERTKRQANLTFIQGKLGSALLQGKLKAVPRAFNKGFSLASRVTVQMWLQPGDGAFDPLPKVETEVTLEPSSEQFLKYKRLPDGSVAKDGNGASIPQFQLDAIDQSSAGPASAVVFAIDLPARTMKESNRENNVGGFFYYILDVSKDAPAPPGTAARVPAPFTAEQMKPEERCKPDRQLLITQRTTVLPDPLNGPEAAATRTVSPATLYTKWHATHFITVTNPDAVLGVTNAVLCNTLTGACTEPFTLAAGASKEVAIAIPTNQAAVYDVIPTVFSSATGIQRGGPFRIIISCAQFTISSLSGDSNEAATVMRGGTCTATSASPTIAVARPRPTSPSRSPSRVSTARASCSPPTATATSASRRARRSPRASRSRSARRAGSRDRRGSRWRSSKTSATSARHRPATRSTSCRSS